jgi:hypothetical protein
MLLMFKTGLQLVIEPDGANVVGEEQVLIYLHSERDA